jgi:hypothetical protein
MIEYISSPNTVLMRMDDGINECINKFIDLIEVRLNDP